MEVYLNKKEKHIHKVTFLEIKHGIQILDLGLLNLLRKSIDYFLIIIDDSTL